MRLLAFAVVGIILGLSTGASADSNAMPTGTVNFGDAACRGSVPCSTDGASMEAIAANANQCSNMNFGVRGYSFDPSSSLDSSGCLQIIAPSNVEKPTAGLLMTPHCCVVQAGSSCHVQCQLLGTH